jgi:hypothetical protein
MSATSPSPFPILPTITNSSSYPPTINVADTLIHHIKKVTITKEKKHGRDTGRSKNLVESILSSIQY